jgi:hypothetical protein
MVSAETVIPIQNQDATTQVAPVQPKNDAQTQIEQAADHFDAFALQMPTVINAKLDAFMKNGFRSILLDDPETKPAEEAMIDSLVKGLRAIGDSLSEELTQPKPSAITKHALPDKKQPANQ